VLSDGTTFGIFRRTGANDFVRGQDLSTHTNLYHMMPSNGTVAVEHQRHRWSSALQFHAVSNKSEVDETRLEPPTPGYAILDLRTAYDLLSARLDFAITNLLGRQYGNPLAGT
jgi:iron complex outermembrane recepter protein